MDERVRVLALTLYGEARGEPVEGIIGCGSVIRNRTISRKQTYEKVCLAPKQFSCWNEDDPNYGILVGMSKFMDNPPNSRIRQCMYIANGIVGGDILDNVEGADHYVTIKLYTEIKKTNPNHWSQKMSVITYKGNHIFLK